MTVLLCLSNPIAGYCVSKVEYKGGRLTSAHLQRDHIRVEQYHKDKYGITHRLNMFITLQHKANKRV